MVNDSGAPRAEFQEISPPKQQQHIILRHTDRCQFCGPIIWEPSRILELQDKLKEWLHRKPIFLGPPLSLQRACSDQQYYDVYFLDYHLVGLNAARLTEAAILHI